MPWGGTLISIILPAYNAEKTIAGCIESITGQAGNDIELLIVDDGSSDETFQICRQQARKARIGAAVRCLRTRHQGVSNARNCGISAASGEWIMFVDADDRLAPGALEAVRRGMSQADLICWNASRVIAGKDTPMQAFPMRKQTYGKGDIRRLMEGLYREDPALGEYYRAVWGKLFRAAVIRENHILFPDAVAMGEDAVFLTRYLAGCERVCFVDEHWYLYTVGTGADRRRRDPEYPHMQMQEYEALRQALEDIALCANLDARYIQRLFWKRAKREYRSVLRRSGSSPAQQARLYRAYCRQIPAANCHHTIISRL